ncbi:MAG: hypothetical protein RIR16_759 [Actinomycetota bacterium]|jgi:hypothetical protein
MNNLLKLILGVLMAISLAGCAAIPQDGIVLTGPAVETEADQENLYYSPSGPEPGATKEQILNGFLNAGTGPQNDYAVAREFLSTKIKNKWQPNERVIIQKLRPTVTVYPNNSASVSTTVLAQIDSAGAYSELNSGSLEYFQFKFVEENGQWRISEAPDLTLVIRPVFEVMFRSYALYFWDANFENLIPDLRWFPAQATTPTRMVTALLAGPSEWLADVAKTAFPSGTKLSLNTVTIANSVATVDFTNRALVANTTQKSRFKKQLEQTLTQLDSVFEVAVLVERTPQEIPDILTPGAQATGLYPIVLDADGLRALGGNTSSNLKLASESLRKLAASDFAISGDLTTVVAATPTGVYLTKLGRVAETSKLVDGRKAILTPMLDRNEYIWSLGSASGSALLIAGNNEPVRSINLGSIAGYDRLSFAISPEGSRLAAVVKTNLGNRLLIAPITRNAAGMPTSVGQAIDLTPIGANPFYVSWMSGLDLVLSSVLGEETRPYFVQVGGVADISTAIYGRAEFQGDAQTGNLHARVDNGDVYRYSSLGWEFVDIEIIAMHFASQ